MQLSHNQGTGKPRPASNGMELQVGVKALLKNSNGKYLVVRRSPTKYPEVVDQWDIVGGRINPGTPLLGNLKREILEETGLTLVDEPRIIAAQDILRITGRHVVRLTYIARIDGDVKLDDDHSEYRWVTLDELRVIESIDRYLKELLARGIL